MFPYLKTLLSLLVLCVHLFAAKLLWFAGYCGSAWIWKRRLNHISSVYRYAKASLILTVQLGSTLCMNYPTEVCHLLFSKYTMQCTYITSDSPQGKKLFSWQQGRGAEARKNKVEKLSTTPSPSLCMWFPLVVFPLMRFLAYVCVNWGIPC